ncbi:hypothetical protein M405DRAFT_811379 [Rhizopogon salebrosus TDB-379]|nr:hypothetical protein M405DRAFT_811379 [Rhizopogon salebrosus TDB-379]
MKLSLFFVLASAATAIASPLAIARSALEEARTNPDWKRDPLDAALELERGISSPGW